MIRKVLRYCSQVVLHIFITCLNTLVGKSFSELSRCSVDVLNFYFQFAAEHSKE